jgi:hypothetical protein
MIDLVHKFAIGDEIVIKGYPHHSRGMWKVTGVCDDRYILLHLDTDTVTTFPIADVDDDMDLYAPADFMSIER